MKAMVLSAIKRMEMDEIPDPRIVNDKEVLIEMKAVGVCGSDMHYYTNGSIGTQIAEFPFIMGHEGSGRIVETGANVSKVKIGDRIAIDPLVACGKCEQCMSGREHTCLNQKFLGNPGQLEGCLSEYIVLPESCCFPVSDKISYEEAVVSEPLAIGVYASHLAGITGVEQVGILGFGPIGMSVKMAAEQSGVQHFYITDLIEDRLAKTGSCRWKGNPESQDIVGNILQVEPGGLDVVFDCCGKQEAVDQAIELLKPGGKLMIVGIPEFDRWSFNAEKMRRKEISIQNVRRQNGSVEKTLKLIEDGALDAKSMITHRFPFAKSMEAFALVSTYKDGVMKAIINF